MTYLRSFMTSDCGKNFIPNQSQCINIYFLSIFVPRLEISEQNNTGIKSNWRTALLKAKFEVSRNFYPKATRLALLKILLFVNPFSLRPDKQ